MNEYGGVRSGRDEGGGDRKSLAGRNGGRGETERTEGGSLAWSTKVSDGGPCISSHADGNAAEHVAGRGEG